VNLAKDVQRKVETNLEYHRQYENYLEKAKTWMNSAKEAIRCGNETTANTSKEVLQSRLDNILVKINHILYSVENILNIKKL